jgi:hypothetical protein
MFPLRSLARAQAASSTDRQDPYDELARLGPWPRHVFARANQYLEGDMTHVCRGLLREAVRDLKLDADAPGQSDAATLCSRHHSPAVLPGRITLK